MRASRWRWHLDEVFVKINAVHHYLWRALDHEREVIEAFVAKARDEKAALKFLKKMMRRHGGAEELVTVGVHLYGAALMGIGAEGRQLTARWENNRPENSHQPFRRRERAMLPLRRIHSLQKFASAHSAVRNLSNTEQSLTSRTGYKQARTAALAEWRGLCAA
jgi:putative transposase